MVHEGPGPALKTSQRGERPCATPPAQAIPRQIGAQRRTDGNRRHAGDVQVTARGEGPTPSNAGAAKTGTPA